MPRLIHYSDVENVFDDPERAARLAGLIGELDGPDALVVGSGDTVATSEYLLHSDHEFPTLEQRHRVGEDGIQHEVLAEYARQHGIDPRIEGRIRIIAGAAGGTTDGTAERAAEGITETPANPASDDPADGE